MRTKRFLVACVGSNGYYKYCISKKGEKKYMPVHQLIAEYFIPNPLNLRCVDHIDNDKANNNINNLRWVNHKENN